MRNIAADRLQLLWCDVYCCVVSVPSEPAGTGVGRMRLLLLVGTSGSGGIYSCLFL